MPTIATEAKRLSNVVKHEYEVQLGYTRKSLNVVETASKNYVIGTVLGRVTASGLIKECVQNASDGSQIPFAVVLEDKSVPANTTVPVLALVRGPAVVGNLVLHSSFDTALKVAALRDSLDALGIMVLDSF